MIIPSAGFISFEFATSKSDAPDGYNDRYVFCSARYDPFEVLIFNINYVSADVSDFGVFDEDFFPAEPKPELLAKYAITEEEFYEVCEALKKIASINNVEDDWWLKKAI